MPKSTESLNNSLFDLLRSKGYDPTILDTSGKEIPVPDEAEVFQFNFVKDDVDYGKVTISIDGLQKLTIYYSDDVANSSKGNKENSQDSDWYSLLKQLKKFAKKRQLGFVLKNSSHLKHDMAKRDYMKQKEKISEGYYPLGKKTSYSDAVPTVKIVIEHTRQLEEGEARYRSINRIFLENQLGEKYLLETKKPGIARVYARHIAEGGKINDQRWEHISTLSEEYNKMSGFVRAVKNNQFNESAQVLVNEGIQHYQNLRETLSRMSGRRGYNLYFESWTPALMEDDVESNNLNELFVQETLDPRIESVMPILSKLHKKVSEMKEIKQLEEWADSLLEYDAEDSLDEEEVDEEITIGGVSTKTDSTGNTTQSYSAGPLNTYTTTNPQGQTVKSGATMDIGGANIKANTDYSGGKKGITTMTGTAKDEFGQQTVDQLVGVQGAASRKGVDPNKFAQFQKNLPTNEAMDDIDSFERNKSSKSDSKQTNKPVIGTIKGGVWTADPPKKGEKGVPVPTPVDEELDESGLQYSIGVKKHGKDYMTKAAELMRNGGTQEELGALKDRLSKAHKGKVKNEGVTEGFNSDLDMELVQLTKSSDMYDAIYNALGRNDKVGQHLQDMMYDIASENRLHPDDDIESIIEIMADRLEDKYQGVAEDLDANQKRVGQLGPTEKVKNNNIGKLVGANENFINMAPQAVAEGQEDLDAILRIIRK